MGVPIRKGKVTTGVVGKLAALKSSRFDVTEPAPPAKRGGHRKPGLWFSKMKVEVQTVKGQHKSPCWVCEEKPKDRRLAVMQGSGRHGWTEVYCIACGLQWLQNKRKEAANAWELLGTGSGCIREDLVYSVKRGGETLSIPQPKRADKAKGEADDGQ